MTISSGSADFTSRSERLQHAIEHVAHYLPAQAPLEVFVHHNTLHAFEDLPFHEALEVAGEKFSARGYLREDQYREAFHRGRITAEDLDRALDDASPKWPPLPEDFPSARALAKFLLLHGTGASSPAELRWQVTEHGALRTFQKSVPPSTRNRLVAETNLWIREVLLTKSAEHVATLVEPPANAEELSRLLQQGDEALAIRALWGACRDVTAGLRLPRPARKTDAPRFHRDWALALRQDDPKDRVHAILIPLCGAFLDRGQSRWAMPGREEGFFIAWRRILTAGRAVRPSWLASLGKRLRDWERRRVDATGAVLELLDELGLLDDEIDAFIEETVLLLPGWAGMFRRLEHAPPGPGADVRGAVEVRLVDFLAVRLTLDVLAMVDVAARLGYRGPLSRFREHASTLPHALGGSERGGEHDTTWPLFVLLQHAGVSARRVHAGGAHFAEQVLTFLGTLHEGARQRIWHEAYELHHRDEALNALAENVAHRRRPVEPRFQLVFCMDDRNESIRRHFEEISPRHVTFGTAGFFNLAIAYQGIDDPTTFPLCPVVVEPRHRILEDVAPEHAHLAAARRERRKTWATIAEVLYHASGSLVWGPLYTAMAGLATSLPLLANVFAPFASGRLRRFLERRLLPEPKTRLSLPRVEGRDDEAGALLEGFTLEEKTSRVATLLENIGLTRDFSPIVALIGHDSSSVNNPHFAAYSCGACGGRSGGPNARLFARMANRPEVRERLKAQGFSIPPDTVFVGGVHDTCLDHITLYDDDLEDIPKERALDLAALRRALGEALSRNAHERARKFASAPRSPSPEQALRHVEGRALDLSQARPELGHATNAACIVGRRIVSSGLFLDRRVFLVSFDPELDEAGTILERILLAVTPVGAGINLEYLFSTTDNERYGAGTKLPHNVTGLFGVMNGASSDLRTGLPKQMIEVHEPVRLHVIIESTPAVLLAILERQPSLRALIGNEWVRISTLDPKTGAIATFHPGRGFSPWAPSAARPLDVVPQSYVHYAGQMGFVPPARIEAPTKDEMANAQ